MALSRSGPASASPKECIAWHEQAGDLQEEGKLLAARELLTKCLAVVDCPQIVKDSCATEAGQVGRSIPSVTFAAQRGAADVTDASVSLDGVELTTKLDGRSFEVDPGAHEASFRLADGTERKVSVVLVEGERLRRVAVNFVVEPGPQPLNQPGPLASSAPATERVKGRSPLVYLFSGLAIGGAAGFGYFALKGNSQQSALDECRPTCVRADYDAMARSYMFADVSAGVGIAAAAGALYLLLSPAAPETERSISRRARLSLSLASSSAVVRVRGTY